MDNTYKSYLILLGFITQKCESKDEEWFLTEALDNLYCECKNEEQVKVNPLITKEVLK